MVEEEEGTQMVEEEEGTQMVEEEGSGPRALAGGAPATWCT
jgi:hypothetical protein